MRHDTDPAVLIALAEASAANAQDYLDEAQWLLRRQRWGRAQMFAILGREELGKASVYLLMVLMPALRELVPLGIRDHKAKLVIAEIFQRVNAQMAGNGQVPGPDLIEALTGVGEITEADNLAKKRGMYVDFEDGVIHRPSDITPKEAKKAVAALRNAVSSMPQLTDTGYHQYLLQPEDDPGRAALDAMWDRVAGMVKASDAEPTPAVLGALMDEMRATLAASYDPGTQLRAGST